MAKQRIIIVIPAYNEEKRIGRTLSEYSELFNNLKKNKGIDYSLLVVLNGCKDKTENIVKKYKDKNGYIDYFETEARGKGYAVIQGFKRALAGGGEIIGFVDADCSTSPEEYWKLVLTLINNPKLGGVIADRYLLGSKITPNPGLKRLIARKVFNAVIKVFLSLPYSDTQCGAKVFRREDLRKVIPKLTMSKWAFDVDLLYNLRKQGSKIIGQKTIWEDREYSTINFWKAGPWMVLGILRLRLINSPLKFLVGVYDRLFGELYKRLK